MERILNSPAPALSRGIAAITLLQKHSSMSLNDLSKALAMPKSSLLRIMEVLINERIADKIRLFSAATEEFPDPRGLANSSWRLEELNSRYAALIRRFQMAFGQQIKEKKSMALRKVRSDFITIAGEDPWLPQELLSADWLFFKARRELNKYISII